MDIQDNAYNRHLAALASLPNYKLAADPKKLTTVQLIDKMVQIDDYVRTIYVRNDKPVDPNFPSLRTRLSMVLIFLSAVTLLYIPVLQKLLLLRPFVMLTRTTLKLILLGVKTSFRLVFVLFICHPMLVMLPVLVLHLTRMIHTSNIFIVKSGRLCTISYANPNPFCCRLFVHIYLLVCFLFWTNSFLGLIFSSDIGFISLPEYTVIANPYMHSRTTYPSLLFPLLMLFMQ